VARYGQKYKDRIVARLLPPESAAIELVSREVGERGDVGALAGGGVGQRIRGRAWRRQSTPDGGGRACKR
jgi:hypothetical protein